MRSLNGAACRPHQTTARLPKSLASSRTPSFPSSAVSPGRRKPRANNLFASPPWNIPALSRGRPAPLRIFRVAVARRDGTRRGNAKSLRRREFAASGRFLRVIAGASQEFSGCRLLLPSCSHSSLPGAGHIRSRVAPPSQGGCHRQSGRVTRARYPRKSCHRRLASCTPCCHYRNPGSLGRIHALSESKSPRK